MKLLNNFLTKLLPLVPKPIVFQIAKRYIAGPTLEDAQRITLQLNARGMMTTLDVLGEFIQTQAAATQEFRMCQNVQQIIRDHELQANLSVKPTAVGVGLDQELGYQHLRALVAYAAEFNNFVRLDMENSPYTDLTFEIYERLRAEFPNSVGVVIQAYLKRAFDDLKRLAGKKLNIRLCKGIYDESPKIAYKDREEIRKNYRRLLEYALQNGVYVGIATHDDVLLEYAAELVAKLHLPIDACEFQMLLGVRENRRDQLVAAGHRLRIYVPFGEDWYGYSTRRLKENPQLAGHVFKSMFYKN
ncbi:proline dehydrogenase family protein [candidate division KSB1 bacterium]|nr:proline dehydrogenase family protein [candidate division KSB1 bacterium]